MGRLALILDYWNDVPPQDKTLQYARHSPTQGHDHGPAQERGKAPRALQSLGIAEGHDRSFVSAAPVTAKPAMLADTHLN